MSPSSDIVNAAECRVAIPGWQSGPVTIAAPTVNPGDDDEDDEDDGGKGNGNGSIDPDDDEGYDDDEDDDDEEPLWAGRREPRDLLRRTKPVFAGGATGGLSRFRFPSRTRHTARPKG